MELRSVFEIVAGGILIGMVLAALIVSYRINQQFSTMGVVMLVFIALCGIVLIAIGSWRATH